MQERATDSNRRSISGAHRVKFLDQKLYLSEKWYEAGLGLGGRGRAGGWSGRAQGQGRGRAGGRAGRGRARGRAGAG